MILRDEQVGGAVAVVVAGNDGARLFELNLVEANVGSDVFESVRPEIAEQAHFALAFLRLADRDEVNPAVVVVVDGGHTPSVAPLDRWKLNRIELFSLIVAPERHAFSIRPPGVSQCRIHPAVVIEIEHSSARCPRRHGTRPRPPHYELPFSGVFQNSRPDVSNLSESWDQNVHGSIVVVIRSDCSRTAGGAHLPKPQLLAHIGECSISIIPEHISPLSLVPAAGDEQVKVAIVVVIDQRQSEVQIVGADVGVTGGSLLFERAVLFVMKQEHTIIPADGYVGPTIVVVVSGGAALTVQTRIDTSLPGYVLELAVSKIVIKRHAALGAIIRNEDIDLAIVVVVEEAGPRTDLPVEIGSIGR